MEVCVKAMCAHLAVILLLTYAPTHIMIFTDIKMSLTVALSMVPCIRKALSTLATIVAEFGDSRRVASVDRAFVSIGLYHTTLCYWTQCHVLHRNVYWRRSVAPCLKPSDTYSWLHGSEAGVLQHGHLGLPFVLRDYMTLCTTPLKYAVDGMYHDVGWGREQCWGGGSSKQRERHVVNEWGKFETTVPSGTDRNSHDRKN